jgi:hypothetical protein
MTHSPELPGLLQLLYDQSQVGHGHQGGRVIGLIGEAEAAVTRRGVADLDRLDSLKALLGEHGHDTTTATLAIFSLEGFHPELIATAQRRGDVPLVDLETMSGLREPVAAPKAGGVSRSTRGPTP